MFDPCVCFDSSFSAELSFPGPFWHSGWRSRIQWQRKQSCYCRVLTPFTWHAIGLFLPVYVSNMHHTQSEVLATPPLTKTSECSGTVGRHFPPMIKVWFHRQLWSLIIKNRSLSQETRVRNALAPLPDDHPSPPPVPASPTSSWTPTTYKSWHNAQWWWTSQAQNAICSV